MGENVAMARVKSNQGPQRVPPKPFRVRVTVGWTVAAILAYFLMLLIYVQVASEPCAPSVDCSSDTGTITIPAVVLLVGIFAALAWTGYWGSLGKQMGFTAPPSWPPAPAGWQPQPGWRPPADFPPAPPGWNFWRKRSIHVGPVLKATGLPFPDDES